MATVRIGDDVNDALKARATAPGEDRSVTQLVDEALRQYVGLAPIGTPAPRARAASLGRPRARAARPTSQAAAKCPHPIGRRIGNQCAACGASNLAR